MVNIAPLEDPYDDAAKKMGRAGKAFAQNRRSARRFLEEEIQQTSRLGGLITDDTGYQEVYGKKKVPYAQVVHYDQDRLIRGGTFRFKSEILSSWFLWTQAVTMTCFALALGYVMYHFDFIPGEEDVRIGREVCNYFSALMGIVFGFYVFNALQDWWSVRKEGVGQAWGCVSDLCMLAAIHTGPEDVILRQKTIRYGLASFALMFKEAQKRSTLGDLIDRGLLTYAEARTLQHVPNKAMAVWVWIGLLWKHKVDTTPELYLKGGAEFNRVIDGIVVQARQALQLVHTFIEVQLPVGFVHLLAVVMKLNFLILTVTCGFEIALALEEQMWSLIIADIFFLIVTPVIFQSLMELTENLRNPLGTDQNDFPQFAYHTEIREENKGYFHASDCFAEVNKAGHAMLNSTGIKGPKTLKTDAAKYRVANGAGKVAASKSSKITPATSPTPAAATGPQVKL